MGFIRVNDLDGETHLLEAVEGFRVMELIRLHGEEEAMLDTLPAVGPTSRLSCQLVWDEHLDGLEVSLAGA